MKVLATLAVSALAQFEGEAADGEKGFDFSSFGDDYGNAFDYQYGYDASQGYYYYDDAAAGRPQGAVDDERYFFTATSTTTTTTPGTTTTVTTTGTSCWKCDAMNFVSCAAEGQMESCRLGDFDCCFVEVRVTDKKLQQLCTGCKDKTACMDNMFENFNGRHDNDEQCRPEMIQQRVHGRHSGTQSVCRQCFKTCNPAEYNGAFCFGSIDPDVSKAIVPATGMPANARFFTIPFTDSPTLLKLDNGNFRETTPNVAMTLGIPTHILVDTTDGYSGTIQTEITSSVPSNVFFGNAADGKQPDNASTGNVWEREDMTYWSLLAGDKAWWGQDLKVLQQRRDLQTTCTFNADQTGNVIYNAGSCSGTLKGDLNNGSI